MTTPAQLPPAGVVPREQMLSTDGLTFITEMLAGRLPPPPMAVTLGFTLLEAEKGRVVFAGRPTFAHLNPAGTVHAGLAATMLDSAVACSVHTTLAPGEGYTTATLELKLLRPLLETTGEIYAEGKVVHRGRTLATAEGRLIDKAGKLYATATTTCAIFPPA